MLRRLLLVICLGLLAALGTAAWAAAHHGYPYVVYYQEELVSSRGPAALPPEQEDLWIDPQQCLFRYRSLSGGQRSGFIIRNFQSYPMTRVPSSTGWSLPPEEVQALAWSCEGLQQNGFHGVGASFLEHATGAIRQVRFAGTAALRFDTSQHVVGTRRAIIWLQSPTLEPLQYQLIFDDGVVKTERFTRTQRLAPGTLPPNLFDPTTYRAASTPWDRLVGWLRDRLDPQP